MKQYNKFAQLTPIIEKRFAVISGIPNSPHPKLIETAYPIAPVWDVSREITETIIIRQQVDEVGASPQIDLIGGAGPNNPEALERILEARRIRINALSSFQTFSTNGNYLVSLVFTYRWANGTATFQTVSTVVSGASAASNVFAQLLTNAGVELETRLTSFDKDSGELDGQLFTCSVVYNRVGGASTMTVGQTCLQMDLIY